MYTPKIGDNVTVCIPQERLHMYAIEKQKCNNYKGIVTEVDYTGYIKLNLLDNIWFREDEIKYMSRLQTLLDNDLSDEIVR